MPALILSATLTCLGALLLGQGALAVCGAQRWSWLAPAVGVATMILLAVPAIYLPGRSATAAAVILALILASFVLLIRRPAHRPPLADLAAGLPVALLALVPFAASERAGTLGVSIDNDMGAHLLLAEAYRSQAVARITPLLPEYPLGPHALTAAVAECLGARTDLAFAGMTAAVPVLLAWTALAAVQRVPWLGRLVSATVVGMPFLIAGFYAEGSFKELFQGLFVLAAALMLAGFQPQLGARRWAPLALVAAGSVSVYSAQGLVWPALLLVAYLAGQIAPRVWSGGPRAAWRWLHGEIVPAALGLWVLVIVLIPQIARVERFISSSSNNGIATTNLGNLLGPLSGWEAFGVWNNADFRLAATAPFAAGMWTAFVLLLVLVGVWWCVLRRQWMLPAAAALAMLVWVYTSNTQSPYVAAKALAVASPLLLLLAALPIVQSHVTLPAGWRPAHVTLPAGWRLAAPLLAAVLLAKVVDSSWEALRSSRVGPSSHLLQLRSLRPLLGTQPTLFLGRDDFIEWELAGARVSSAYSERGAQIQLRAAKGLASDQPLDFDSVDAATLDSFDWVITTRDAAASAAPAQMRLVRVTPDYELWRRVGEIEPRETLEEGPDAGAIFNCRTATARALLRHGGVAAVRAPSIEAAAPSVAPGTYTTVKLSLGPGDWDLQTPYQSPLPLQVSAPGLHTTLPANLDPPGPRWPIGRILLSRARSISVTFHTVGHSLMPSSDAATPWSVIATPASTERILPLRSACGRLVDWYRRG